MMPTKFLPSLALATLVAAPAAAQCPGAACDPDDDITLMSMTSSSPGPMSAPFVRQPMFTLPQFDVDAIAAENMVSPADVELICVQFETQGIIVPTGTVTNNSGDTCDVSWQYTAQAALYENAEVPVPGTLFISNNTGTELLDNGSSATPSIPSSNSIVTYLESADFTGWEGSGDLVWEGDGLAVSSTSGCMPVTGDFDNVITLTATVTYTYCIPKAPTSLGIPYCFGDGSGTACPCANESMVGAGQGCQNGNGVGAIITASGTASLSADDLVITCTNLIDNNPAILISGLNATGGGDGIMDFDGLRCAGGSLIRHGQMTPGPDTMVTFGPMIANTDELTAGETRRFQVWYRSPGANSPCGTAANFSNGYEIVMLP